MSWFVRKCQIIWTSSNCSLCFTNHLTNSSLQPLAKSLQWVQTDSFRIWRIQHCKRWSSPYSFDGYILIPWSRSGQDSAQTTYIQGCFCLHELQTVSRRAKRDDVARQSAWVLSQVSLGLLSDSSLPAAACVRWGLHRESLYNIILHFFWGRSCCSSVSLLPKLLRMPTCDKQWLLDLLPLTITMPQNVQGFSGFPCSFLLIQRCRISTWHVDWFTHTQILHKKGEAGWEYV